MKEWLKALRTNPIGALKKTPDVALDYFVRRDLQEEKVGSIETLWELPEPLKLVSKQADNGCWHYPSKAKNTDPLFKYDLLETYRSLRILVDKYGFTRQHVALEKAAEYVFSCQTGEGDIRGILGNHFMPYYHAVILEELIKAGFENDRRVIAGLDWLLTVRQDDGAWIVPFQGVPPKDKRKLWDKATIPPDRSLPFSHMATGMVLRAFAAHPSYRQHPDVLKAAGLLKSRFFHADKYNDRQAPEYWLKFQYPFFWTSLLTALDTLHLFGFTRDEAGIQKALTWFIDNQGADGLWPSEYGKGKNAALALTWVTLAICRVLKYYG